MRDHCGAEAVESFRHHQQARQPVVFVGPYDHHSNEVTWRQGLATEVAAAVRDYAFATPTCPA